MDDREAAKLAKALSNPLRIRFLRTLQGRGLRGRLTRREFSEETGVSLHNLEMHIDALRAGGMLEVAEMLGRRGAQEHHYSLSGARAGVAAASMDRLAEGQDRPLDYQKAAEILSALGHPLRVAYLRAVGRRGRSGMLSPGEFARESGEERYNASYHVRVLRDRGVIEVAEVVQQRGAPEYWYSASGPRAEVTMALVDVLVGA